MIGRKKRNRRLSSTNSWCVMRLGQAFTNLLFCRARVTMTPHPTYIYIYQIQTSR